MLALLDQAEVMAPAVQHLQIRFLKITFYEFF